MVITYLPVDGSGTPVKTGRASAVRIFARAVTWPSNARSSAKLGPPTYDLGTKSLAATISYPRVDEPGSFGAVVEKDVRRHVYAKTGRKAIRGAGGSLPGPDARWQEIANLYGELARLTGDPYFAEISAELQSV
ncbi:hypothetical protein [Mycolicibacterium sp.]|uniref:hypothetical protein n=1 Tax=Mycolicibacterium sp. TaxID=2320850 RepID=UPI0037CAD28A